MTSHASCMTTVETINVMHAAICFTALKKCNSQTWNGFQEKGSMLVHLKILDKESGKRVFVHMLGQAAPHSSGCVTPHRTASCCLCS